LFSRSTHGHPSRLAAKSGEHLRITGYRLVTETTAERHEGCRTASRDTAITATASGDEVILSSRFTGTVQVIDRKTGKTKELMHGFKAPHDAVRLGDGSFLVNELGTGSLVRVIGEHGANRTPIPGGLAGPAPPNQKPRISS
jgi:hypothetical protein